jgi:ADP-heptose:LPS heptosyltransferase
MSMKPKSVASYELQGTRTCVIFPGALGDFICFLPALHLLAHRSQVDLFAQSQFADIAPKGVVVQSLERPEMRKLFVDAPHEDEDLKRFFTVYDEVYSWLGSGSERFVARLQSLVRGKARLFPFRPVTPQGHQAEYYLNCCARDSMIPSEPMIVLRRDAVLWCASFWADHALHRPPVLVIAPGSGAREKNWPEDFFLAVVQWWRAATGGVAILLIGPVENERGGIERLRSHCLVVGDLRLSQVAALLCRCTVYLGNDSGVSHLAATLGARTIAIFGPSDARQWAPRGGRVIVVQRNIAYSPCLEATMKSCPHRACLAELQPSEVISILGALPEVVTLTRSRSGITV